MKVWRCGVTWVEGFVPVRSIVFALRSCGSGEHGLEGGCCGGVDDVLWEEVEYVDKCVQ